MTRKSRYSDEFQKAAVERVVNGMTQQTVADELGVKQSMIAQWMQKWTVRPECIKPVKESAEAELARLRRENNQLKEANEILKKAAAYFAKSL